MVRTGVKAIASGPNTQVETYQSRREHWKLQARRPGDSEGRGETEEIVVSLVDSVLERQRRRPGYREASGLRWLDTTLDFEG
jgi:hypothetical protein